MKKSVKVMLVLAIVLFLGVGVLGAGYWYIYSKTKKINQIEVNPNDIEVTEGVEEQLSGYRNIVLFGIDSRENNYDKGNRSDCIILATINNKTKAVKLTSIYRDTYLKITGRSLDKVTHAYSYGGPVLAMSTLNENLDLDIKEFVTLNFEAVQEIVDRIGGIELDIAAEEIKYMNQYINEQNQVTSNIGEKIQNPGKQLVNGTQALAYARIRYTAGGDYKRTERMRIVLMAVVDKAKTKKIGELNKLADEIFPKINTNINATEIMDLLPQLASYKIVNNVGWPYQTEGATINGIWYGPPNTLESNVTQLHKELFEDDNYKVSDKVKQISEEIIKKTKK